MQSNQQQESQLLAAFRRLSEKERQIALAFIREYSSAAKPSAHLKLVNGGRN